MRREYIYKRISEFQSTHPRRVRPNCILIYNLAIRVVPKLIRLLGTLFRFCTGKLKELFSRAKEACYKL